MANQNNLKNQKLQLWLRKNSEFCDKLENRIRWLSEKKNMLSKKDYTKSEDIIQESLKLLDAELKKIPNVDLMNKYMELKVMWQEYMMGMKINSPKEENIEAEKFINDIMKQYNEKHYENSGKKM